MPNKYAHDMYPNDNNYEIQYMKINVCLKKSRKKKYR
jgi:hypothetical protein